MATSPYIASYVFAYVIDSQAARAVAVAE